MPHGWRPQDGTIIPKAMDTMWGADLNAIWTAEGQVAVFVAIDHCSSECVGIHAARRATRFEALEPICQPNAVRPGRREAGHAGRCGPAANPLRCCPDVAIVGVRIPCRAARMSGLATPQHVM